MSVWSVVSVDWRCRVWPSGLTTTLCVRAANVSAAPCVACAAKLPTHPSLCCPAACATGLLDAEVHQRFLIVAIMCGLVSHIIIKSFLIISLLSQVGAQ